MSFTPSIFRKASLRHESSALASPGEPEEDLTFTKATPM